jgi:superoxide reductase
MQFGDVLKNPEAEGKEKHVPVIELDKGANTIRVVVGKEVAHPNTIEHHIAWAELYGVKQDGQVIDIGRASFAPSYTSPNVVFSVPIDQFKAFCALSYCNIHGVWQNCVES